MINLIRDCYLKMRINQARNTLSANSISTARTEKWELAKDEFERASLDPDSLMNFEKRIFSQNGEDGIIEEIFRRIGVTNKYFVEFGSADGRENCSRHLLEHRGWRGLWIEGDSDSIQRAQSQFSHYPVTILERFIDAENILQIFHEAQVPAEFDMLAIDVDGNDYWLWKKISQKYSPRLLVMEYNGNIRPEKSWIMPYNPKHRWDRSNYYGASLKALTDLARKRGYTLVACDAYGVNAFFVRNDLVQDRFKISGRLEELYCVLKYPLRDYRSPERSSGSNATQPVTGLKVDDLNLEWARPIYEKVSTHALFRVTVFVENRSEVPLRSTLPYPVLLSYYWKDAPGGSVRLEEGPRTELAPPLLPRERCWYAVRVQAPSKPGLFTLHLTLIQERVFWFSDRIPGLYLEATISVE